MTERGSQWKSMEDTADTHCIHKHIHLPTHSHWSQLLLPQTQTTLHIHNIPPPDSFVVTPKAAYKHKTHKNT